MDAVIAIRRTTTPQWALIIMLGLLVAPLAPAGEAPTDDASALIERLGLIAAAEPSSDLPGWRAPTHIVVRVDSDARLAWLQQAVPEVELINAGDAPGIAEHAAQITAVTGMCDGRLFDTAPNLHWIQVYSAGVDACIDQPVFQRDNIVLTNMQRSSGPQIAEHVMAMLLAMTRGLDRFMDAQREGRWRPAAAPAGQRLELGGRTMLIVGLGGIGTEVARRAAAFDMRVLAIRNTRRDKPPIVDEIGMPADLAAMAARADVVVNSTPLTDATRGLFDAEFFAAMKPGGYFINVGRGPSVDTDALIASLESGRLAGAGLDVTDPEPLPSDHPLWSAPNVIITPHVSAGSDRLLDRVFLILRENLRRYAAGEPLLSVVNIERGY